MYKLFFILPVLFFTSAHAGTKDEAKTEAIDLSLSLSVLSKHHELEFLDNALENYLIFKPNNAYIVKTVISYKNHDFLIESDELLDTGDDDSKGESMYLNLEYAKFIDQNKARVYYEKYDGFYVSGQQAPAGNYFVFEDINTKRYGLELTRYSKKPRLRHINNGYQNIPKKRFWTAAYGLLFDVSYINNIPSDPTILSQINKSELLFFNDLKLITLSPFAGLLGRYSTNGYYIESGLNLGYGLQIRELKLNGITENENDYTLTGSLFLSLGKEFSDHDHLGISFQADSVEPSIGNNEFSIATLSTSLFYSISF